MLGVGFSSLQIPGIYIAQTHFDKHRALAQGLSSASQSFGQMIWSPLTQWLFNYCGWRGALMILAGIQLHTCICAMLIRKNPKDGRQAKIFAQNLPSH